MKLAKQILEVREKLVNGLSKLGYKILGKPESSLLSFTHEKINIFYVSKFLKMKGWYPQDQPGNAIMGYPKSIHLTISPVHKKFVDRFLNDLEEALDWAKKQREVNVDEIAEALEKGASIEELISKIGFKEGKMPEDMVLVNELMHSFPPEMVEEVVKEIINDLFKP